LWWGRQIRKTINLITKHFKNIKQIMKENMKKQVYLTPAVQVKVVAVENGFLLSTIGTETITNGGDLITF
jgi:hypothetical protein